MWSRGAFDGDSTEVRITLQGLAESTVLVDGLHVMPIERVQPTGNCFACPVGGADILRVALLWISTRIRVS